MIRIHLTVPTVTVDERARIRAYLADRTEDRVRVSYTRERGTFAECEDTDARFVLATFTRISLVGVDRALN